MSRILGIMPDHTDKPDAPFYYQNRFVVIRARGKSLEGGPYYVANQRQIVGDVHFARQYASAIQARRGLARLPKQAGILYEIEEIVQEIGPITPLSEFELELFERIPLPYYYVAHEWHCGGDVKSWLLQNLSRSTYYRYRRKLLEYGIDIAEPCKVRILNGKKCT